MNTNKSIKIKRRNNINSNAIIFKAKMENGIPEELICLLNIKQWVIKKENSLYPLDDEKGNEMLRGFYSKDEVEESGDPRDISIIKMKAGVVRRIELHG